jgi:hypothetical protein
MAEAFGRHIVARHPPHGLTAVCESGEMKDAPILKLEAVE